jgi:broad specificity phosphatase PhoE
VYFIRHAESVSNAPVNRFKLKGFKWLKTEDERVEDLRRKSISRKDAPLSDYGHSQARRLGVNVFKDSPPRIDEAAISGKKIVLAVSNLARTQQTMVNFLKQRVDEAPVDITILNCLQEANENGMAQLRYEEESEVEKVVMPALLEGGIYKWDISRNKGGKVVDYNRLNPPKEMHVRFTEFNKWLDATEGDTFLVAGHSGWLKEYINDFLTGDDQNVVEIQLHKTKLGNASMAKFVVDTAPEAKILPKSTCLVAEVDKAVTTAIYRERKNAGELRRVKGLGTKIQESFLFRKLSKKSDQEFQQRASAKRDLRARVIADTYCNSGEFDKSRSDSVSTENSDDSAEE